MNIQTQIFNSKIFIVDDQQVNVDLLESVLEQFGFVNIYTLTDSRLYFDMLNDYQPDIVLLDLMMPFVSGYDILDEMKLRKIGNEFLPVVVLTSDITNSAKEKALKAGAKDFLNKPFDINEICLRIFNHLETKLLYRELEVYNEGLKHLVDEQTKQLQKAYDELKTLEEAKLHFLKIISHEIRTPLNGIKGFSEIIKLRIESKELLEYFGYLEKSVERLETFSYQALMVAQLQSGTYKPETESININYAIVKAISAINAESEKKNISVNNGINSNSSVNADKELFEYLLKTAIGNAIKYSFDNQTIDIEEHSNENNQSIVISNIGPDIPDEIINEDDYQLFGLKQKHVDKNTGLDLILIRLIMKTLKGSVIISKNQPSGIILELSFPAYNHF